MHFLIFTFFFYLDILGRFGGLVKHIQHTPTTCRGYFTNVRKRRFERLQDDSKRNEHALEYT